MAALTIKDLMEAKGKRQLGHVQVAAWFYSQSNGFSRKSSESW